MLKRQPTKTRTPTCDTHRQSDATYRCSQCHKHLCDGCVKQDAHLFFCSHCGGFAQRVITISDEPYDASEKRKMVSTILRNLAMSISNHILVPIATIAMVAALLFFLLDVRAVFWRGTTSLKQIGFFFVVATVLIARYGKVYELRARQILYTGLMAGATLLAMLRFAGRGSPAGFFASIAVVVIVWRFATKVTNSLDLVEEEPEPEENRFYGVQRLKHEEMEKKYNIGAARQAPMKHKKRLDVKNIISGYDAHGNPTAAVAKLAGLAILIFAMGEPILLSGAPEIGQRALATVIIFLLSTGVVLAAASAAGTYRHTIESGGTGALSMVPLKIFLALILLVAVLAVGMGVPGIQYKGKGKVKARYVQSQKGTVKGKGDYKDKTGSDSDTEEIKKEVQMDREQGDRSSRKSEDSTKPGGQNPLEAFIGIFAAIGKLLVIPLVLFIIGFIFYTLYKILPALKGWRLGFGDRFRKWLEKLRGLFKGRQKKEGGPLEAHPDPLKAMAGIETLSPRDAVLTAYRCLLAFVQQAGHKHVERLTPYEYLSSLPESLNRLSVPAGRITGIYVNTAYSKREASPQDQKQVYDALVEVRHLVESK